MPAVISATRVVDHINSDGVHRAIRSALSYTVPTGRARDDALEGYLNAEMAERNRPADDERRVYRKTRSREGYSGYCSTAFREVYVSLPRVAFLDGAYRPADRQHNAANDNRQQEASHEHGARHAAA